MIFGCDHAKIFRRVFVPNLVFEVLFLAIYRLFWRDFVQAHKPDDEFIFVRDRNIPALNVEVILLVIVVAFIAVINVHFFVGLSRPQEEMVDSPLDDNAHLNGSEAMALWT